MRVILLRHGETAWNRDGVFRGIEDVPLNDQGKEQASRTGQYLQRVKLSAVFSSPLSRSRDTALLAARPQKLPVEEVSFLNDMDFGQWQGLPVEDAESRWPEEYGKWLTSPHQFQAPGGESLEGVFQRASKGLENLLADGDTGNLLLVSHRVIIKLLLLWAIGADSSGFWRFRVDPCSLSFIILKKGYSIIERMNDTCHLEELSSSDRLHF